MSGAAAADVPHLDHRIVDQTGVLANDESAIEDALQVLYDKTGVHLYVLFVNSTGSTSIADYAIQVGEATSIGPRDAVLVVALQDKTDNISLRSGLRDSVAQDALDNVRLKTLEPGLASGDYGGAVVRTANALGSVFPAAGTSPPAQSVDAVSSPEVAATPDPASAQGSGGGGPSLAVIVVVIAIVVGGLLILGRARQRGARRT